MTPTRATRICLVCEGISETDQERCASCGLALIDTDEVHFPIRRGEQDAAHPLLGALVDGTYRIDAVLGKGGMGTVFAATHEVSLQTVALKILHPRYAARADHRRSFVEEARKAGRVIHEHSARVLDVGEDSDGTVFIAMELVEGATLQDWIHGPQRMSPALVLEVLHQICRALAQAHDVGVVHRDLSPRNVMCLVREGRPFVKILDFGIALGPPALGLPDQGPTSGGIEGFANPPYSAPEHLEGKAVDGRADLYSLGVLAYEALTGRLPVDGRTAREAAEATLEGRLRPFRPPPGTPRRLTRLVRRLLQRSPSQRPADAHEVIREINRIRQPRAAVLRVASLAALMASLPLFVLAHRPAREPFLTVQGSWLVLADHPPVPSDPAQELQSRSLDELVFRYGGFRPDQLKIAAHYLDGTLESGKVQPEVDAEAGLLTLSTAHSPRYADLVAQLAALPHPSRLEFRVPGREPLRFAKVLVDDAPPAVELRVFGNRDGVLNGAATIDCSARDKGTVGTIELSLEWGRGELVQRRTVMLDGASARRAGELLPHVAGTGRLTDVTLRARAQDGAGNVGTATRQFAVMDLAVPAIAAVSGDREGSRLVTYDTVGASLRLELDEPEADLTLSVEAPDGKKQDVGLAHAVREHEVRLPPFFDPSQRPPFEDGYYTFIVRDAAANESEPFRARLLFRTVDPEASLTVERAGDAGGRAEVLEDESEPLLVTDGGEVELLFHCNPIYERREVTLQTSRPVGMPAQPLALTGELPGSARLRLPPLPEGEYRLVFGLADASGARITSQTYALRVMAEPVDLLLPDTRGLRFLHQLLDVDVLERDGEGFRQGPAWSLGRGDARLLRGRIWVGREGQLTPRSLPDRTAANSPLLPLCPLLHGENVVALELSDPLGRPVQVVQGGRPAPSFELPDGRSGYEVCRFVYREGGPVLNEDYIQVEYGQPARFALSVPLPFEADDDIRLRVRSSLLPAKVKRRGTGSLLELRVGYELLAAATGLAGSGPEEIARGRSVRLRGELETPAGSYPLDLPVQTIRSALRAVALGELARGRTVDAGLTGIVMVPVLAPEGGVWRDPVGDVRRRSTFRPGPPIDVDNVEDLYLQQGELTRRAYHSLMHAAEQVTDADAARYHLVHAWDRAGPRRLQLLRPLAFGAAEWEQALAAAPDRPVTGVSFYQAYTMTRLAGVVIAGDPDLFRLPMGLELELAALGNDHSGALNGCGRTMPVPKVSRMLALEAVIDDPALWPPTRHESAELGDSVRLPRGEVTGLDFGVCEWVLDLPPLSPPPDILQSWLGNHDEHCQQALELAKGAELPSSLQGTLEWNGVVRGAAVGDATSLVDARTAARVDPAGELPATVPGVVRGLVVQRDGLALDRVHPYLRRIGFRLAGGRRFVQEVRR